MPKQERDDKDTQDGINRLRDLAKLRSCFLKPPSFYRNVVCVSTQKSLSPHRDFSPASAVSRKATRPARTPILYQKIGTANLRRRNQARAENQQNVTNPHSRTPASPHTGQTESTKSKCNARMCQADSYGLVVMTTPTRARFRAPRRSCRR